MAAQDAHPSSWFETDGCSGVLDFTKAIKAECDTHDVDHHWGGADPAVKLRADLAFRHGLATRCGWLGRRLAPIRFKGVRTFTYNEPPEPGVVRYTSLVRALLHGRRRLEAWNWQGPGRGIHANMPAQPFLLPVQRV